MKTRTLLLLSVGTALAILLAGGVLLFQLSNESDAVPTVALGERGAGRRRVDHRVRTGSRGRSTPPSDLLGVDVELAGVDDPDGLDSFRLVTGDRSLAPVRRGGRRTLHRDHRSAGATAGSTSTPVARRRRAGSW